MRRKKEILDLITIIKGNLNRQDVLKETRLQLMGQLVALEWAIENG